jgi:AcrR family transcriptional regulator
VHPDPDLAVARRRDVDLLHSEDLAGCAVSCDLQGSHQKLILRIVSGVGLRERKRAETRRRIAEEAARLASMHGIPATTVDQIADGAGVGRATFFRYFDSKELAVATGLSEVAIFVFASVLADMPDDLGPLDAVRATHATLAESFEQHRDEFLEQALLSRSSLAMQAWTLQLYVEWEVAIAELIAPRFDDLAPNDPRPRMIGAMTMAAVRLACDDWVADGGRTDLPALIRTHLGAVEVSSQPHVGA